MLFRDKVAIITGAVGGFGSMGVRRFVAEGAKVIAADIDAVGLEQLAQEVGENCRPFVADVSKPAEVEAMVRSAVDTWGRLDVLWNNAAYYAGRTSLSKVTLETWDRTIGVTLSGVFYGCKYALPIMMEQKSGVIINTSSAVIHSPTNAYDIAKFGVTAVTIAAAKEGGPHNVRCVAIAPVIARTQANPSVMAGDPKAIESAIAAGLLPFMTEPEDIVNVAIFVASDAARCLTGCTIPVDRGNMVR
jgi:3-oxoacyl-[acyl-carrier protein] reductase